VAETAQERTESATPKRLREARRQGQVARSKELASATLMLGGTASLLFLGPGLATWLAHTMEVFLSPDAELLRRAGMSSRHVEDLMIGLAASLGPFLALMVVLALLAPLLVGGWNFTTEALVPKWDRLDPVRGMARLFSLQALVELAKTPGKFMVVAGIAVAILWGLADRFLAIGVEPLNAALAHAGSLVGGNFLVLTTPLIVLAIADVPWQLWQHQRQLRMSRQEIRDELKETDGRPEVKGRIRRLQQELAQRRMMEEVPKADVVITNPSHFAIALRYDGAAMDAPLLIAKGADLVAVRIKALALQSGVPVVEAPPLARSIYYTTELGASVPSGLYVAVAQVLAFVFQLRAQARTPSEPIVMDDLPIPEDMERNQP